MRKESKVRTAWTQTICAGYCWSFAGFEASSKRVSENKTVPHSSDTMTLIQEDFVPKIANNLRKVTKKGTNTQHFISASLFKVVKICWISNFLLWPVDFKLSRLHSKKKISMKLKLRSPPMPNPRHSSRRCQHDLVLVCQGARFIPLWYTNLIPMLF